MGSTPPSSMAWPGGSWPPPGRSALTRFRPGRRARGARLRRAPAAGGAGGLDLGPSRPALYGISAAGAHRLCSGRARGGAAGARLGARVAGGLRGGARLERHRRGASAAPPRPRLVSAGPRRARLARARARESFLRGGGPGGRRRHVAGGVGRCRAPRLSRVRSPGTPRVGGARGLAIARAAPLARRALPALRAARRGAAPDPPLPGSVARRGRAHRHAGPAPSPLARRSRRLAGLAHRVGPGERHRAGGPARGGRSLYLSGGEPGLALLAGGGGVHLVARRPPNGAPDRRRRRGAASGGAGIPRVATDPSLARLGAPVASGGGGGARLRVLPQQPGPCPHARGQPAAGPGRRGGGAVPAGVHAATGSARPLSQSGRAARRPGTAWRGRDRVPRDRETLAGPGGRPRRPGGGEPRARRRGRGRGATATGARAGSRFHRGPGGAGPAAEQSRGRRRAGRPSPGVGRLAPGPRAAG